MTLPAENAKSSKSTKWENSDFSVFRSTNSNWDFGLIWICTEEFEFLDVGCSNFSEICKNSSLKCLCNPVRESDLPAACAEGIANRAHAQNQVQIAASLFEK